MNRREFLGGSMSSFVFTPFLRSRSIASETTSRRPNIVLMLVDDLGYGDFACYGDRFHETPNIDRLCKEGVKFTDAYAAAPVCSPSRAAILTGQHPARLHLTQWIPGVVYPHEKLLEPKNADHLPMGVPTLATELKKLGYKTGSFGKWHLGGPGFLPEDFGFDVNIAGDDHGHPAPPNGYFGPFHYHNLEGYTKNDNLTEVLSQKAHAFMETAAREGPFFLYLAEYAVHMPLAERPEHIAKYERKNGNPDPHAEPDPVYAAMVESVDTALGKLRAKLDALGVADNTIIIVTSDNGGVSFQGRKLHRVGDNGPLHGGKGYLYEGGIREPLIVYWPGKTKPGSECQTPVFGCDFMPTLLSMAGAPPQAIPTTCDGLDFSPLLRSGDSFDRDTLYWHYPHYSDQGGTPSGAIRQGDWKLIEYFEDGHLELYNLKLDVAEQNDFSMAFADKAVALQAKLAHWRASLHGAMPTLNPGWDPARRLAHRGALGCSVDTQSNCLED